MTTPIQQKIRNKTISSEKWASMVKSGDWILSGSGGAQGRQCMDTLADRLGDGSDKIKDIELWGTGTSALGIEKTSKVDTAEKYSLMHENFWFGTARKHRRETGCRDWRPWGWSMGTEQTYYRNYHPEKSKRAMDWVLLAATHPEHGRFNYSYGTCEAFQYSKMGKKVVVEMREDYPWCEGSSNANWTEINIDDVDYIVECDVKKYPYAQTASSPVLDPIEKKIAEHIVDLMHDGDCIQIGIGGLPEAVVLGLRNAGLKHLGLHTELLTGSLVSLMKEGVMDNSRKEIDTGKSVWTFACIIPSPAKEFFDFIHHNNTLAMYPIFYTNNWISLSRISHMVAINNCVAIDLMGQQSAGYFDGRPISGTGGYFQFMLGAPLSRGGRAFCAIHSTRKMADGRVVSRILPTLPLYSSVDVPGQFAQWVVTEYGAVNLWGTSMAERTERLISIAHPDFREELRKEAYKQGFLRKNFPVPMSGQRRYPTPEDRRDFKIPYMGVADGFTYGPDGEIFSR